LEELGFFTVKSAYNRLEGFVLREDRWREEEKRVFESLWENLAPSKVVAFVWKVLLDRIPSKVNLAMRQVLPLEGSTMCTLCAMREETSLHLLLHCDFASSVWLQIMVWFECFFHIPPNLFVHWECWGGLERNSKIKKGRWLVWLATLWLLWKVRNDSIFNQKIYKVEEVVEEIKVLSWRWILSRTKFPVCLFYEWCWDPIWCLNREGRR